MPPPGTYRIAVAAGEGHVTPATAVAQCAELRHDGQTVTVVTGLTTAAQPNLTAEVTRTLAGPLTIRDCTGDIVLGSALDFVHIYPQTSVLNRVRVEAIAGGRSYVGDPRTAVTLDDLGEPEVAYAPYTSSVASLVGQTPNRRFALAIYDASATDAAGFNQWCVVANGGTPACVSPGILIAPGTQGSSEIDLIAAALPVLTSLDITVDLSHSNAGALQIALLADAASRQEILGAELKILGPFTWETLAANAAPPESLSPLSWDSQSVVDSRPLSRRLQGVDNRLELAVVPLGVSGAERDLATIVLDSIRAEASYRLPP